MIVRLILIAAGLFLILSAKYLSPAVDRIAGFVIEKNSPTAVEEEDDILDNKKKWKLIIAGYIIFALVSVFSLISVFTLNNKINTLYKSVQELESRVVSTP